MPLSRKERLERRRRRAMIRPRTITARLWGGLEDGSLNRPGRILVGALLLLAIGTVVLGLFAG